MLFLNKSRISKTYRNNLGKFLIVKPTLIKILERILNNNLNKIENLYNLSFT